MKMRFLVIISILLLIIPVFSGCTWFSGEDDDHGEEFQESELIAPEVPSYPPHEVVEKPPVNESQLPPGFSYNITWAMGEVYSHWGSFIRITIENTGINDLFIYRCGIEINWSFPSEWVLEDRDILIPTQEEKALGVVYFRAPKVSGEFTYNILISILVKDNELLDEFGVESWYDNGTIRGKDKTFTVSPLEIATDVKVIHNYKYYQDKLKKRIEFDNSNINSQTQDIISEYEGDYNIYQVLAIFDFMVDELTYISDPEGRDYWAYCWETLIRKGGDCEDFSILFSSMIGSLGGTTRIYLTQTHAFPALYIGLQSQKNEILDAIIEYYGTEPNFVIFEDDGKYWLSADPAGSLYMGGLPADAQPALASENPLVYGFIFKETKEIHAIDIIE
jgi:hypothetical protein